MARYVTDDDDRDVARARRIKDNNRPIIDNEYLRGIIEYSKYRDLIEYPKPKVIKIRKKKLVI